MKDLIQWHLVYLDIFGSTKGCHTKAGNPVLSKIGTVILFIFQIKDYAAKPESEFEYRRQQFETVVDLYQEQPHLLDPHLQACS